MESMMHSSTESVPAIRFLNGIRELLVSDRCVVVDKDEHIIDADRDRVIGYRAPDGGIWLLPIIAKQAIQKLLGWDALDGISNSTLYKQWDSMGYIATHDEDKRMKSISVKGHTQWVLHLTEAAIYGPSKASA